MKTWIKSLIQLISSRKLYKYDSRQGGVLALPNAVEHARA